MKQPRLMHAELDATSDEWWADFDRAKFLRAARRALSICNKLKPSPTKARHASRIFRAINKARAA